MWFGHVMRCGVVWLWWNVVVVWVDLMVVDDSVGAITVE